MRIHGREGERAAGGREGEKRARSGRSQVGGEGFSTWRLAEAACRLNTDSISQSPGALDAPTACSRTLFLAPERIHFSSFLCNTHRRTVSPSPRAALSRGCVGLIGISVFEK